MIPFGFTVVNVLLSRLPWSYDVLIRSEPFLDAGLHLGQRVS